MNQLQSSGLDLVNKPDDDFNFVHASKAKQLKKKSPSMAVQENFK